MSAQRKIYSVLGIVWAAACFFIVLATFLGLGFSARMLAEKTGIHVSPRFAGGEVNQTLDHGTYSTKVHRMVFDGLLSEREEGFVQIDFVPHNKISLPPIIEEYLDINRDGSNEIGVRIDTDSKKAVLILQAPWVEGLEPPVLIDSECVLRIRLRNPHIQAGKFQ
jgi:hypothetical protein